MNAAGLRIGVLGGTFDPIHHGHLAVASEVCEVLGLDRVLVVPANDQPFKDGHAASAAQRLTMARVAIAGDDRLEVSSVDIDRGGVTYTVDTLTDLANEWPGAEWFFITGADALARLNEWKEPVRLRTLATFVGVTRPGYTLSNLDDAVVTVEVPSLDVSSTELRRRVSVGLPLRYLVPDAVAEYIDEQNLYHGGLND